MTKEKGDICLGCQKPWKGNSLYCSECQRHNVGTTEAGLAGLVATYKPGTAEYNAKYTDACHKCGKENTVSSKGWFCEDCIITMSFNKFSKRYGEV